MEIGLTGASGFLGREFIDQASLRGDSIIAYSRNPHRQIRGCMRTELFGAGLHVNGLDAVVHLAGESFWEFGPRRRKSASSRAGWKGRAALLKRSGARLTRRKFWLAPLPLGSMETAARKS